jgi:hypothetical protein
MVAAAALRLHACDFNNWVIRPNARGVSARTKNPMPRQRDAKKAKSNLPRLMS